MLRKWNKLISDKEIDIHLDKIELRIKMITFIKIDKFYSNLIVFSILDLIFSITLFYCLDQ